LTGSRGGASHSLASASVVLQRKPQLPRKSKVQALHTRRKIALVAFSDWFLEITTLQHGTFVDAESNLNTSPNKILCRYQAGLPVLGSSMFNTAFADEILMLSSVA